MDGLLFFSLDLMDQLHPLGCAYPTLETPAPDGTQHPPPPESSVENPKETSSVKRIVQPIKGRLNGVGWHGCRAPFAP